MPIFEEQNLTEFLAEVKLNMENITDSHEEDIQEINDYIFQSSGKFIRSKLIFIYGTFLEVDRNDLVELSSATELIHISTLIHDDIIDDAPIRRGKKTIFKKWELSKYYYMAIICTPKHLVRLIAYKIRRLRAS